MRIADLYQLLCDLYGVPAAHPIEAFLIASPSRAAVEVGSGTSSREALLIRQEGDDVELGLFIDPAILAALAEGNPLDRLDDLACAVEGVSHFLAVTERLAAGRPISLLELELQGEVDKFLIIHLIAAKKYSGVAPEYFHRQFERFALDPRLTAEERERYATASHFAAKFCFALRRDYFNPLRLGGLREKTQRFFRDDLPAKISSALL